MYFLFYLGLENHCEIYMEKSAKNIKTSLVHPTLNAKHHERYIKDI